MRQRTAVWRFINTVMDKSKWNILVLLVMQAFLGICGVLYALLLREIINSAVKGEFASFWRSITVFTLLVCLNLLLHAALRILEEGTRSGLENRFKCRLFSALLRQDYGCVSVIHSGEWMNRLTNDTVVVANGLTEILPGLTGMAFKLFAAVFMILILEPRFMYLLVPGGVILLACSTLFRKHLKMLHCAVQEKDGALRMYLQENLGSMMVVRSYGVEDMTVNGASERMAAHRNVRLRRTLFSSLCNFGFGAAMNGMYILGALFCGYGILTKTMSYGNFMAVLQLVGQVQAPFANISGYLPRYYAMMASCERLMEIEPEEMKASGAAKGAEEIRSVYQNELTSVGLRGVWFSYPELASEQGNQTEGRLRFVLSDWSLDINKGEFIAFTGRSGCGKSTVLKILLCLYRIDRGERYVCRNGHREPLDESWRGLFAYVPQGNHLMSGTIREAVSFSNREAGRDDERLHRALSIACAEFVYELEDGPDTLLGERGLGLSEGQMQRLAIARAIFSERPILMFDEVTSALDEETEHRLLMNLRTMTDKTVLLVTHRPAALSICDRVVEFI